MTDDTSRKYEVTGLDDLRDVHAFRTNDEDRAREMLELMQEELDDAELTELATGERDSDPPRDELGATGVVE